MPTYQLVERKANPEIKFGEIDEEGDRTIWITARSDIQASQYVARHYPQIRQGEGWRIIKHATFDEGLDVDLIKEQFREGERVHAIFDR